MDNADQIPSIQSSGSIFAMYGPSLPEWRKIIKITGDPVTGFQTELVQDYKLVKSIEAALELADGGDTPAPEALLMSAWQALAMYLSSCDDEDKGAAVNALKVVSDLMTDGPANGPTPAGTFGVTMQSTAAAQTMECSAPNCDRTFSTEQGLINHLKNVHAKREKQTKATPANDKD